MASKLRIAITTGDNDGIGPEVATKALQKIGPVKNVQFVLFRSQSCSPIHLKRLKKRFKIFSATSLAEGLWTNHTATLIDIASSEPPARWVELCANLGMEKQIDALVTGPLSKTSILNAGMKDLGHTEILSRISQTKDLFMGFLGRHFSVVLVTGHMPLSQVSQALTPQLLKAAVTQAHLFKKLLPKAAQKRPLALVGLNPHAGETGLLGNQETWFKSMVTDLGPRFISGPLVPDAAFLPGNWPHFSIYVCPYHDQGLIPFKMTHGFDDGVHVTLGLPFIRTSVDHGTAVELVGKNLAKFGSMKKAIETAVKMAKEKRP